MKRGVENKNLQKLIVLLEKSAKKNYAPIWKYIAKRLGAPRRKRIAVNVYDINKYTKENDMVVVPGRVIGIGSLTHPVVIGAYNFSKSAREKIEKIGGKIVGINELVSINPKGTGIIILQ